MEFLTNIILTSLLCLGVYKAFDEGMVFGGVAKWIRGPITSNILSNKERKLWMYFTKPLFDCPPCMASFWGLFAFHAFYGLFDWSVIPFIFCVSGLNWLLSSIAER